MSKKVARRSFGQPAALSSLAVATKPSWRLSDVVAVDEKATGGQGLTQFVDVFIGAGGHGHTLSRCARDGSA